ncbi:error-prone DNA polymerase [Sporichthya polymorpha]|uniref:error-prone DNA polymerase n=1 Tax=Sporichthya polymorpha TaxID=35751 RepID=UPI0003815AFB
MGWENPPMPWRELEKRLSGKFPPTGQNRAPEDQAENRAPNGQKLAFGPEVERPGSYRRAPYRPKEIERATDVVPYAELHAHSNFSFLDGASHPEEMVEEAVRLGLTGLAITDHDGFYGVVRFAEAAEKHGLSTIFGSELSLGLTKAQNGVPDPEGTHLLVLARDPDGYARLSTVISEGHARGGEKGRPIHHLEEVAAAADGHWLILTGCRKGAVPAALTRPGPHGGEEAAARELDRLVALFGRDHVAVELTAHGYPDDDARLDALAGLARRFRLPAVATGNAHYATPERRRLATALAAVRARRSLDELAGWLPAAGTAHLHSGAEMAARFARYPGAVASAHALGQECAFNLSLIRPRLPDFPVPAGHTAMSWLRELTYRGARERYGPREAETQPGAWAQIDHELAMIERLDFPGYFLIVHEIVDFARSQNILCQGRGSAANSAVCYALGITAVDAVYYQLLFERFLSPERGEPPDIDIDIESGRREEVIQHVYERYGRRHAAQVANVISYRPRSAVRDMAKALGYSTGAQDAFAKEVHRYSGDVSDTDDMPADVLELAGQVARFPRHLGIHSGGMVICDRPVVEVVPVEWARMENRTVIQWDKDDCASPLVNLVKFDLLGLGMLSALHGCFDLIRDVHGTEWTLQSMPKEDPEVYEMLCRADSVGVFQVESRAQMATLPRLKPRCFYDLVLEIALIRPGPIQGGSVHPFIRRRAGKEPITYPHPSLENCLKRTLGVPMFQEQLMQMVVDAAGCTPEQADRVRRAVGSKRSPERVAELRAELYEGMRRTHGITGETADTIFNLIAAFANFGFAESHSISFALLVYASSWQKLRYPAAFCAALLNAQPMGFYSPQSLVADARRHGVEVRRPDVNLSAAGASLEPAGPGNREPETSWGRAAIRLGLSGVRSIGDDLAERIESERRANGPYVDLADFARRTSAGAAHIEALSTAGAFDSLGLARREALWAAGAVAQTGPDQIAGTVVGHRAPRLPELEQVELTMADLWATGITPDGHPMENMRAHLNPDILPISALATTPDRSKVRVAGVVTHRQQPQTAAGTIFLNLEDETGMLNVICSPGAWARHRRIARDSAALVIRGRLERSEGVISLVAENFVRLEMAVGSRSRDFR